MDAEKTGCFVDVVDLLNKQNMKLMIIRDTMATQREHEGWYYIIDDMMEENGLMKDKVELLHLRSPGR